MGEDFWPFRPAPSIGPPAQDSSPPARPVLTMDPSFGRDRNWSPKGSPPRVPTTSWRPWEPPLPETWGCPRGPFAEQLWKLGLRPDGPNLPGVENDVSETALRAASKLSDTEFQLRSLAGNEEEQLQQLRARHQQNLESLGMLQKSMLLPTATVTPSDMSMPPMPPMPPVPPVPPVALRARDADLSPSMRWDGAPLQDLVAASVADGLGLTGIASLSAGPLPRCAEWLSRGPAMVATAIPQAGTAPDLFETAGPLPPPALSDTGEDAFQTQGLEGRLWHWKVVLLSRSSFFYSSVVQVVLANQRLGTGEWEVWRGLEYPWVEHKLWLGGCWKVRVQPDRQTAWRYQMWIHWSQMDWLID